MVYTPNISNPPLFDIEIPKVAVTNSCYDVILKLIKIMFTTASCVMVGSFQ